MWMTPGRLESMETPPAANATLQTYPAATASGTQPHPLLFQPLELILFAAWHSGKTSLPPREPWLDPAPQAGAEGGSCSHRDQLWTGCQASPAVINPWFIIKTLSCWCTGNLLSLSEPRVLSASGGWAGTTSLHKPPPSPGKRALQSLQQLPSRIRSPTHFVSTSVQHR